MEKDQSSNRLSNWLYIRPLEESDESTIEEIVIDSIVDKIAGGEAVQDNTAGEGVAVRDKTAGESEAIRDKIAGGEAAHDNTAGERVREFTVDPFVGLAVLEAVDRVDEDTYPRRRRRAPRGRRRWWYVRGERICRRSAGSLLEVCQGRLSSPEVRGERICRRSAGSVPSSRH